MCIAELFLSWLRLCSSGSRSAHGRFGMFEGWNGIRVSEVRDVDLIHLIHQAGKQMLGSSNSSKIQSASLLSLKVVMLLAWS